MTFCELYPLIQGATLTAKGSLATGAALILLFIAGAYVIERGERKRKKQRGLLPVRYHLRLPPGKVRNK